MRILIDLTSLADNFSGIERYALNISKQAIIQDNKNRYVLIFKNKVHKDFEKFKDQKNIEFKIINGKNKLIFNQVILPYYLYKFKCDKYLFLAFPNPILFFRKGIINTIHDLTCWDYPQTMKFLSKWYFRISISSSIRRSEMILTVSNFSKKRIIDKFGNKKEIIIIYNGISEVFENFRFNNEENCKIRSQYNLPDKYIMSLGTLEPRKNLKLLIKVFIELKRENLLEEKLVLVGRKGWKFKDVIDDIEGNIKNDIIFTGFVDDDHLPYIYRNSSLFIFPSIYEGFGIPLLEAISMNTPILVSDIESFKEILDSTKCMFKSGSSKDLKNKMLNRKECNQQVSYNKSRANLFKWNIEAKKVINILQRRNLYE